MMDEIEHCFAKLYADYRKLRENLFSIFGREHYKATQAESMGGLKYLVEADYAFN